MRVEITSGLSALSTLDECGTWQEFRACEAYFRIADDPRVVDYCNQAPSVLDGSWLQRGYGIPASRFRTKASTVRRITAASMMMRSLG
jgi:hypothetical protein